VALRVVAQVANGASWLMNTMRARLSRVAATV